MVVDSSESAGCWTLSEATGSLRCATEVDIIWKPERQTSELWIPFFLASRFSRNHHPSSRKRSCDEQRLEKAPTLLRLTVIRARRNWFELPGNP
jgi:hypothetical protein